MIEKEYRSEGYVTADDLQNEPIKTIFDRACKEVEDSSKYEYVDGTLTSLINQIGKLEIKEGDIVLVRLADSTDPMLAHKVFQVYSGLLESLLGFPVQVVPIFLNSEIKSISMKTLKRIAKEKTQEKLDFIKEIKRKYCQLGLELKQLRISEYRTVNAQHSHSKLGIFLEEYFGTEAWRQPLE